MKRCLYCGIEVSEESVIDFCYRCGESVFGEKMLKTIIENMNKAKERGDINQGIISQDSENLSDKKSL